MSLRLCLSNPVPGKIKESAKALPGIPPFLWLKPLFRANLFNSLSEKKSVISLDNFLEIIVSLIAGEIKNTNKTT